jgi:hypothetical protein
MEAYDFKLLFEARPHKRAERMLVSACVSVCLSVRMEKLGYRWTNFHEI